MDDQAINAYNSIMQEIKDAHFYLPSSDDRDAYFPDYLKKCLTDWFGVIPK